jgi:hypothetical protein
VIRSGYSEPLTTRRGAIMSANPRSAVRPPRFRKLRFEQAAVKKLWPPKIEPSREMTGAAAGKPHRDEVIDAAAREMLALDVKQKQRAVTDGSVSV